MYVLYIHVFISISIFTYWKPIVHWYPWFQTNTIAFNIIFPFSYLQFLFLTAEIWLYVFISAFSFYVTTSHAHACLFSLALTSCLDAILFPILASSPCAALHHWTGALLTHLGLKNSLWANFPPHIDSLLISFGLWFSTLGLCPNSHHM